MANKKHFVEFAMAAALFAGLAGAGLAQTAPGDAIAARKAAMKSMGGAVRAVGTAAQASDFDTAATKAGELSGLVKGVAAQFPAGSGPEAGISTGAKPEVWTNAAGFKAALDKSIADADAVGVAVASKDAAAVATAISAFQANCGSCHAGYRGPAS